jgi:hypothetical protein
MLEALAEPGHKRRAEVDFTRLPPSNTGAIAARSDGLLHLSDIATFLTQTSPLDTTQTGPSLSFQNLLEPS